MVGGKAVTRARFMAGMGFSSSATCEDLLAAVDEAVGRLDASRADIACIAVPDFKRGTEAVNGFSEMLGVAVNWVSDEALAAAQARCSTRSEKAREAVGFASVAEAAALAAAGPQAVLALSRIEFNKVTCALAALPPDGEMS